MYVCTDNDPNFNYHKSRFNFDLGIKAHGSIAQMITAVGKLLRLARESRDMTQRELAKTMGFSHVFLSRIEVGLVPLPAKYVRPIAEALRISHLDVMAAIKSDACLKIQRKVDSNE